MGFVILVCLGAGQALSLPIGFGYNQGDVSYNEIVSRNFYIYHDSRVPHEGAMTANALEGIKPVMDRWFGIRRSSRLPVISSALSANASFANFITDAIELQTLGEGDRDLFWHEYVHTMMYEHFHNFFGPAGSVLHLPWVPAWFLEGLAESLSVSVGSDVQASVERYQALTNRWPSYDRLHSLYGNSSFFLQGYTTAGGFVGWLLRKSIRKPGDLKKMLSQFYSYTTPLYFPWSFNPFSDFMPVDEIFRDFLGKNGESLYDEYRKEARDHWIKNKQGPFLVQIPGRRLFLTGLAPVIVDQGQAFMIFNHDGVRKRSRLEFNGRSGWLSNHRQVPVILPQNPGSIHHVSRPGLHVAVTSKLDSMTGRSRKKLVLYEPRLRSNRVKIKKTIAKVAKEVSAVLESPAKIIWMERYLEKYRLCYVTKDRLKSLRLPVRASELKCPVRSTLPNKLRLLGDRKKLIPAISVDPPSKTDRRLTAEVWFNLEEQTLAGNRSRLLVWDAAGDKIRNLTYDGGGTPLQMAVAGEQIWLLVSERNRRSLRRVDTFGRCQSVINVEDYVTQLAGSEDGTLILGLYEGSHYSVLRIDPGKFRQVACRPARGHTSPLLWAVQQPRKVSLAEALDKGAPWNSGTAKADRSQEKNSIAMAGGLDRARLKAGTGVKPEDSKPASWRPRPVLTFPWIGADDALGSQMGLVSIPLMDHMQNETLRLTALYGLASRYPSTELTLNSTRFWPTLEMGVYRRQLWNGVCRSSRTGNLYTSYLDEKGIHSKASFPWAFNTGHFVLGMGLRAGFLKDYFGPCQVNTGRINEPYVEVSAAKYSGRASYSISLKLKSAPEQLNRELDYNVISGGIGASFTMPFLRSRFSLGLEGSRTRGKKTMLLKEIYQPLKTFVPGSGGGYNKNSFPLTDGGSLFTIRYGDTQARFRSAFTFPVLKDLDKMLWLFYFQSLNFTSFYNYGGAWYHGLQDYRKMMISAHGYKFDLLFENKGVGFNVSLGSGQVVGDVFQVYLTLGFDAFF